MGNEAWTEAMEWPGAESFHAAKQREFIVESTGESAGVYKGAEGLTFMRVCAFHSLLILYRCMARDTCIPHVPKPHD